MYHIAPETELSPLACAYARARGADRMSSFGDWIALSRHLRCAHRKADPARGVRRHHRPGLRAGGAGHPVRQKEGQLQCGRHRPRLPARSHREHKQVYGITFEQGRNELVINADTMLNNWVTENKDVTEEQKRDLIIAPHHPEVQPVRRPTTGSCAMDKVLDLPFRDDLAKPNRDNAIDVYIDAPEDVIGDDVWADLHPPARAADRRGKRLTSTVDRLALVPDAFFLFGDNIERARRSGVTAIVQPGGSIRDQQVIDTCNKYGIAMAFCGLRLFHHDFPLHRSNAAKAFASRRSWLVAGLLCRSKTDGE